jgi:TniQ
MESYQEWDVTIPVIPPRSRLYRLEPIGIETPYVESLTSYIARLAQVHHVTPKYLIMREVMPFPAQTVSPISYYSRMGDFFFEDALLLNGSGPVAKHWIERLQFLTSCETLRFLTMSTWSEVIATKRMLRRRKAWCPVCYEEWRQTNHIIYEPLLWTLASVTICLRHQQMLVTSCPRCQKSLSLLAQVTRPGYCSHCGLWLGNALLSHTVGTISSDREELKDQYWVAEVVGELLAGAPLLSEPPRKEQIAIMTNFYLEHHTQGNVSALARLVKLNKQSLRAYLQGTVVPYFDSLLHLCSALSITPLEFLATKVLPNRRILRFIEDIFL